MCEMCDKFKTCVACEYGGCEEHRAVEELAKPVNDSSVTAGTDRAVDAMKEVKNWFTDNYNDSTKVGIDPADDDGSNLDPNMYPNSDTTGGTTGGSQIRDNMFELLRDTIAAVPQKYWSRLGIGYTTMSGQSFPEACALHGADAPVSFGPQGEPLFRYSEDQPRDPNGEFASGGGSNDPGKVIEHLNSENPVNPENDKERLVVVDGKTVGKFEVTEREGRLRIKGISSDTGNGNLVLGRITDAADKEGVTLELTASPYGSHKLDSDALKSWYGRHGFTMEQGYDEALGYMIREPNNDRSLSEPTELRFSEDQPRDPDGKFAGGGDVYTLAGAKELVGKLGDGVTIIGSVATKGESKHDLDLLAASKETAEAARVKLEGLGYEWMGNSTLSPKEAAAYKGTKTFEKGKWSVMDEYTHTDTGKHVEVWHTEAADEERSLRFNADHKFYALRSEQRADDEGGEWITIHGAHVFIKDGVIEKGPEGFVGKTPQEIGSKQAAARPTDEQRDLRAGYKEAFDAAREKFTDIAGKYGVISGRVKDLNSIAQKMATNPNYTGKPLSELKDVAGLRCTCPNVAAVRDCVAALREQSGLKIVGEQENKMDTPQGFYRAIHEAFDSMGENKFGERVGEIQVRTERQGQIAMWGHDCAYKGPYKKDEEVQAYARAVSNAAWELDNGRPASYPEKVPAALAERDLAFKPEKTYTDDWLFKERGDKYWEQTS